MNSSNNVVSLAGRILLSAIFVFSGIGKIAVLDVHRLCGSASADAVGSDCRRHSG